MSESSYNTGTKKKTKKRRKGKNVGKGPGGAPKLPEESATDMPKVCYFRMLVVACVPSGYMGCRVIAH